MAIVPSGKRRQMMAQNFEDDPLSSVNLDKSDMDLSALDSFNKKDVKMDESTFEGAKMPDEDDSKGSDVGTYIFSKLESLGYPPRRLEEFENEFINEKIYPGGVREVTIIIPDRYYGMKKRLSTSDFSEIVKEIQDNFGLNFVDAERKDKKISMNFTSQSAKDEDGEEEENEFAGDVLEEVYGPGDSSRKSKPKNKSAMTMRDMLKMSKEKLVEKIIKEKELK